MQQLASEVDSAAGRVLERLTSETYSMAMGPPEQQVVEASPLVLPSCACRKDV